MLFRSVETSEEREDWLRSIQQVANGVRETLTAAAAASAAAGASASAAAPGATNASCEVIDVSETGDPFLTPYSRNPYQRSGKTRYVLFHFSFSYDILSLIRFSFLTAYPDMVVFTNYLAENIFVCFLCIVEQFYFLNYIYLNFTIIINL